MGDVLGRLAIGLAEKRPEDYGSLENHRPVRPGENQKRNGSVGGACEGGLRSQLRRTSLEISPRLEVPFLSFVGLLIAASGVLLHILPYALLLNSHCTQWGCLQPGCNDDPPNQCIPCFSDTIMGYKSDPHSRYRHFISLIAVCVRAPVCFFLVCFAHCRLLNSLVRAGFPVEQSSINFELVALAVSLLDVVVVLVPNIGATKLWHILAAVCLMSLWTLALMPLFVSVISAAQSTAQRRSGGAFSMVTCIWVLWFVSFCDGVFLIVGWNLVEGAKWYAAEWIYVFCQGISILMIGLVLWRCEVTLDVIPVVPA